MSRVAWGAILGYAVAITYGMAQQSLIMLSMRAHVQLTRQVNREYERIIRRQSAALRRRGLT